MAGSPKPGWRAGTGLLAATGVVAGWALWSSSEPDPYPVQPEGTYAAAEARSFTDLATMTASSALVVRATATDTGPGETIEYHDGAGSAHTEREVTLAVEEVLYQRYEVDVTETIVMIDGYWDDGVGYAREGVPWVESGDSGYFYLSAPPPERRDSQNYSTISQHGRVLLGEDLSVDVTGHWEEEGPWAAAGLDAQDARDASTFEKQIETAAEAAAAGTAEPELVTVCEPSEPGDEDSEPVCWEQ